MKHEFDKNVQDTIHLLIPPIKELLRFVPGFRRWVCFEIINHEIIEFLVVEVVVNATPLASSLESKVELCIVIRNSGIDKKL